MKRIIYFIIISLVFTFSLSAQDMVVVTPPSNYIGVKANSVKTIIEQNAQQLKLANNFVSVFYTKEENKFIVVKQSRFSYSVTYVLITTDGKSISIVDVDYIPQIDDFDIYEIKQSLDKVATSNVEFLLDTECDYLPSAVNAINTVANYVSNQGYNVQKIIGSSATPSTIKNSITNNDLVAMGNVGHGNPYVIQLRNGTISHSWFAANDLRGEIYFFNSCEVYNSPFISSMLDSGKARTYSGGVLTLPIGLSEEVFKDFWVILLMTIGKWVLL